MVEAAGIRNGFWKSAEVVSSSSHVVEIVVGRRRKFKEYDIESLQMESKGHLE
jgi:hypothetical protein